MAKPQAIETDLTKEQLEPLLDAPELALDCEMMGLNPHRDRLCLVQLSVEQGPAYLIHIDEQAGAPHLKQLLAHPDSIKIFHFARMDLLFLYARLGIRVENVWCTKIASRLVRTYTDRHGLRELVREICGENLDKSNQSSDWGKDRLSSEQLHYAYQDVKYLFKIRRTLLSMLEREDRHYLAETCFHFLQSRLDLDLLGFDDIFTH